MLPSRGWFLLGFVPLLWHLSEAPARAAESYDYWLCTLTGTAFGVEADSRATLRVERATKISPTQTVRETVYTNFFGAHRYSIAPKYSSTSWPQYADVTWATPSVVPGIWVHEWARVRLPYEHCIYFELSGSVQPGADSAYPEPSRYYEAKPGVCTPDREPLDEKDKTNCPIVLDVSRNGYHLTDPEAGVRFDIDADGVADAIAWTSSADDDGLLCRDRNGNGFIDDGAELFGWATPLASGLRAGNGYVALAELDGFPLGGDANGRVDAGDRGWSELCIWRDSDHDGKSQPAELSRPSDLGIVAIQYDYHEQARRDSHGNVFRYSSTMVMKTRHGPDRKWPTYDVIFAE